MLRVCSFLVLMLAGAAQAEIRGAARVVDGDTLSVNGQAIRLFGIDAPERDQTCQSHGRSWPCGAWAGEVLHAVIASRPVTCDPIDTDRYARIVARCHADGRELGAVMVAQGAAMAYRRYAQVYVADEQQARDARVGIWRDGAANVVEPADYRARRLIADAAPQSPVDGCVIKGNISDSGRIYHRPGQRDYARTRISPERGERWFCSEDEAVAAGWRPAQR